MDHYNMILDESCELFLFENDKTFDNILYNNSGEIWDLNAGVTCVCTYVLIKYVEIKVFLS